MSSPAYNFDNPQGKDRQSRSRFVERIMISLLWIQGAYYFVTGVWPLLSVETFQLVTGRKTDHLVTGREGDHWLVMTVGVLILSIALTLLAAAWRKRSPIEVCVMAITSALGLTGIDIVYVSRGVISPVYLVDAAAEVVLISLWLLVLFSKSSARSAWPVRSVTPKVNTGVSR